ncbi:Phage terminase large subunit [compost metagenome]
MNALVQMNPKLRKVWFRPARIKIVHGGRASSKSYDFATALSFLGSQMQLKIVVARQFQNSISQSCKSLIESRIEAMELSDRYDFQRTTTVDLETGTQYLYYGIARNLQEIKSLDGVDILVIEEAGKLTKEQWEVIEPTIRKQGSEIWLCFNPDLATDFAWSLVLNPPADSIVMQINYPENPFLSDTMKKSIADAKKRLPKEDFDHIYLGVPRSDDQLSFIKPSWLRKCIDSHKVLGRPGIAQGKRRMGFDIADAGEDTSAVALATGNFLKSIEEWASSEDQLLESTQRAYHMALEADAILVPDVIGVGASSVPKIIEMNNLREPQGLPILEYSKFHAGEAASDTPYQEEFTCADFFTNMKAEAWGKTSDRARNTFVLVSAIEDGKTGDDLPEFEDHELLSISSEIECLEKLIKELSSPRKIIDLAGRTMVEKKADMKNKRGIPSPNLADAAIIALYSEESYVGFFD